MTTVKTEFWAKPMPDRRCDWAAWVDGHEELCTAYGPTEEAALAELAMDLEDLRDRPDLAALVREHMRSAPDA